MLIYNTTFQVEEKANDNFLVWIKECYIAEIEQTGLLHSPQLTKVLSHNEEGYCYALQWKVEDSSTLHKWHLQQGMKMNQEITKIFKDKVVGFPTLMEVIE